ncbi:MAG TPA: ATP synthase F1 subunit delta [Terriglobales bacterium]|nr:ATP synthase F1 subunit delta [Terriglobales bacterium]
MSAITSRYARAFVDVIVADRLDAAKTLTDLHTIAATAQSSPELRKIWESPAIVGEQKRRLLDAIVAREGLLRQVRNFVAVLIDHRRVGVLDEVVRDIEQELNSRLGFAEALITSARDLSDSERRELEAQVERLTGKKVRARYVRDASLLGGAVVKLGSTIYDGSVKGQLRRIREQLSSN